MNQSEHLALIISHLRKLLALSKERTPGKWYYWNQKRNDFIATGEKEGKLICGLAGLASRPNDFSYIAACSQNAEAGWESTIAAIEALLSVTTEPDPNDPIEYHTAHSLLPLAVWDALKNICLQWPIELLTA